MPRTTPLNARRAVATLLGVAGSVVFTWLALRTLRLSDVSAVLRSSRLLPWVPLAAASYLTGHFLRGYRCVVLMSQSASLGVYTASNIVVAGYASNNVLPARLGEIVRASMLVQRTGLPLVQALTITAIERLFDGMAILLLLGASAFLARPALWIVRLAEVGGLAFGSALVAMLLAVVAPELLLAIASRLSMSLGPRWHGRAVRLASSIVNGTASLTRVSVVARVVGASVGIWLLEAGLFALVMPAVGLDLNYLTATLAMGVTNLAILIPSTPGYVGPFHYFCAQTLASQGVPVPVALSYAVLVHLTFYLPVTLWGAGVLLSFGVRTAASAVLEYAALRTPPDREEGGVKLASIAFLRERRPAAGVSEYDRALTEAFLPAPETAADRAAIETAAAFVAHCIAALPLRLRFLYTCGSLAFCGFIGLRYGSRFVRLPIERRRAAVDAWAYGRVGLLRQLFRPVRSTALLAYYDASAANKIPHSRIVSVSRIGALGEGTSGR